MTQEVVDYSNLAVGADFQIPNARQDSGVFYMRSRNGFVPKSDESLILGFNARQGVLHVVDPVTLAPAATFELAIPSAREQAFHLLSHVDNSPTDASVVENGGRQIYEDALRQYLPYDPVLAREQALDPAGTEHPELVLVLDEIVSRDAAKIAKNLTVAGERRMDLIRKGRGEFADRIESTESILEKLPEDQRLSLLVLAAGDSGRLTELVSEHRAVENMRHEREDKIEQMTRAVGEFQMLYARGVPKAIVVARHFGVLTQTSKDVADIAQWYPQWNSLPTTKQDGLREEWEKTKKQAGETVSGHFVVAHERYAAATMLANRQLAHEGRTNFRHKDYETAVALHEHGLEDAAAVKAGLVEVDHRATRLLDNERLANAEALSMEGIPFHVWQETPVVPHFMESERFRDGNTPGDKAENIMVMLESASVSNHGGHVAMQEGERAKLVASFEKAIIEGRPIRMDMYYCLGRMTNPLETNGVDLALQDWTMFYKLARVAKTAELFYTPDEGPGFQWVIINEANAFGRVWDLKREDTDRYFADLEAMLGRMSVSDTFLFDDLERMADENREAVQPIFEANYAHLWKNWRLFESSGVNLDMYVYGTDEEWKKEWEAHKDILDKKGQSEVQEILDIYVSQMRIITPTSIYKDMTLEDLFAVYRGIVPGIPESQLPRTPRQAEILQDIRTRALEATIYYKAMMKSRDKEVVAPTGEKKKQAVMRRLYAVDGSVAVTDKEDKIAIHAQDRRTLLFASHGMSVLSYTRGSSVGSPEAGNPWFNVLRMTNITGETTVHEGKRVYRYIGVHDPSDTNGQPLYWLEVPTVPQV